MTKKKRNRPRPPKKPLTTEQKRRQKEAKAERQRKYQWKFLNGKKVRVKRPPTIDGLEVDEFIRRNACDIWLTQEGMYEILDERNMQRQKENPLPVAESKKSN